MPAASREDESAALVLLVLALRGFAEDAFFDEREVVGFVGQANLWSLTSYLGGTLTELSGLPKLPQNSAGFS